MLEECPIGTAQIAERYSITQATAQKWLHQHLIHGQSLDGRWYCTWDALFAFEGRISAPQGAARDRAKAPLLTCEQIASRYDQHPETIRKKLKAGQIPGRQIMRRWYSDWDGIAAYEADMRAQDWRWAETAKIGQKQG